MLTALQTSELARAMSHASAPIQRIDAGYTYFGQFIAHDIVNETRSGGRSVSHRLDLDSLYGASAKITATVDPRGYFPIVRSSDGSVRDLPRLDGAAQIPERRNDDNVIVAQFHLLWMRFHNFLISHGYAADAIRARELTTLIFQLLTVEDYLRLVLAPEVFESYFRKAQRWLEFAEPMPVEFSHAAFRFGHAMVRPFYEDFPRDPSDVPLAELFRRNQNIPADLHIDWRRFFGWAVPYNGVQDALAISPNITEHMSAIPVPGRGARVDIVKANLEAGVTARLSPGKEYVERLLAGRRGPALREAFKLRPLDQLGADLTIRLAGRTGITIDNLPLWPYVLVEAMDNAGGRHLATFGSLICAEVLLHSIVSAPVTIYPAGKLRGTQEILAGLGRLGEALDRIRSAPLAGDDAAKGVGTPLTDPQRTLCIRHLIELIEEPA